MEHLIWNSQIENLESQLMCKNVRFYFSDPKRSSIFFFVFPNKFQIWWIVLVGITWWWKLRSMGFFLLFSQRSSLVKANAFIFGWRGMIWVLFFVVKLIKIFIFSFYLEDLIMHHLDLKLPLRIPSQSNLGIKCIGVLHF